MLDIPDRMKVVEAIMNMYLNRGYRQEDIAKELKLTTAQIGKVTRNGGVWHGIKKELHNLKAGQTIEMVSFYGGSEFNFLDSVVLPEQ